MKIRPSLAGLILALATLLSAWMPAIQDQFALASAGNGDPTPDAVLETPLPVALQETVDPTATPPATPVGMEVLPPVLEASPVQTDTIPTAMEVVPTATPTPEWVWNPPGEAIVPILLYHHIADIDPPSRYFVSPQDFELQLKTLQEWGYTSISLSKLVEAVDDGAELPPRPVILTFDDGYMDVYENAFPLMQKYGFTGVTYIIVEQLEIGGYQHVEQLQEMLAAGWEVGSHTQSHSDLRQAGVNLTYEITESKQTLETLLDVPVQTFSFPYGMTSPYATRLVQESGYQNAVGLGGLIRHIPETIFYLSRIEVRGDFDLNDFTDLLPWVGEIILPENHRSLKR